MKYISHIPLIGGFTLAAMNITKTNPIAITSYSLFNFNDSLLLRYFKEKKNLNIPYYQLDKNEIPSFENVDFVCAIPPCNSLSMAATRPAGTAGTADSVKYMYMSSEYILGNIKPKVFIFENAPTLYTPIGTNVRNNLIDISKKYNYSIVFYKTNTLQHGIPQNRPRTYVLFTKTSRAPILENYNKPYKNIKEYLKEIPSNSTLQNEYMCSEFDVSNFEIVKYFKEKLGKNWRDKILEYKTHISSYNYLLETEGIEPFYNYLKNNNGSDKVIRDVEHIMKKKKDNKNFRLSYRVLILDKDYIYAIVGEMMQRNIHPTEERLLNIREYLTLMGHPFDFDLYGKKEFSKIPQNAPVKTNEDMIKEVIAIINGERKFSNEKIAMQDNTKPKIQSTKSLF